MHEKKRHFILKEKLQCLLVLVSSDPLRRPVLGLDGQFHVVPRTFPSLFGGVVSATFARRSSCLLARAVSWSS